MEKDVEGKMTEDEKYVREQWKETIVGGLYLYESARSYHLQLGAWEHKGNVKDKASVWSAAAGFTRTRLQQIRDVEEEIDWLNEASDWARDTPAQNRILAREQTALADLKRGLRVAE